MGNSAWMWYLRLRKNCNDNNHRAIEDGGRKRIVASQFLHLRSYTEGRGWNQGNARRSKCAHWLTAGTVIIRLSLGSSCRW
jgi:hypothetical protein